jgi:hypothetical protein
MLGNLKYCERISEVKQAFGQLVDNHVKLIEIRGKVEKIFSPHFLFNFIMFVIVIGLAVFVVANSTSNTTRLGITCILGAFVHLYMLFCDCYLGQLVVDAGEELRQAVYDSGWESWTDMSLRKSLNIVQAVASKGVKLTCKFKTIDLKLFHEVKNFNF